ncbi:MAG: TonB-dependent receptor [Rhodocyclaceae bacterium]|nr:TonB-dependent receptor [Rhodocyclaceae bacterium]
MYPRLKPLAAILSLIPITAVAAETLQLAVLDPVIVTASRQAQRASEVLSDVTVIEAEEIRKAGPAATINQLLSRQPGIEINQKGGPGTDSNIFIRGTSSTHALVLVDGMRLGSTTTGAASWGFIPLEQVDRIEIIRGSCSSLYGSDAIGGVIQIFTKRGNGPLQMFAEAGYGTWNTSALSAGLSGSNGGWRYSFQLAEKRSDSYSAVNNSKSFYYNADKDGFQNTSSSGSLSYSPAKGHEFGVNYLYSDGWNRYDSSPKAKDYKQEQTIYGANVFSRNRLTEIWTSTVKIGKSSDDGRQFADNSKTSTIRSEQTQFQWQNDINLPLGSALLAVERVEQAVSGSVDYALKDRSINSALAGWTGQFAGHRLQVNVRNDDNSQFGDETTGLLAYGYQFTDNWRGNVSYGTGFKAPTFNDMYWPGAGNPDLKPETSENIEGSIHFETATQHASLTYYRNEVDNLIEWAPNASGFWMPANVAKARLRGWTLAYNSQLGDYKLSGSIDLQDPEDTLTNKVLRYRARQIAKIAVSRYFGAFNLGGEVQVSGQRYNDAANTQALAGYGIVNLTAAYRFAADWSVFARANNIFDKDYTLVNDFATPGANVFIGVRYSPK